MELMLIIHWPQDRGIILDHPGEADIITRVLKLKSEELMSDWFSLRNSQLALALKLEGSYTLRDVATL